MSGNRTRVDRRTTVQWVSPLKKRKNAYERQLKEIYPETHLRFFAQQHLEWMLEHNYSFLTVCTRNGYLNRFFKWCEERSVTDLSQVNRPLLERYQKSLYHSKNHKTGEPLTFSTQTHMLGTSSNRPTFPGLKSLLVWCAGTSSADTPS